MPLPREDTGELRARLPVVTELRPPRETLQKLELRPREVGGEVGSATVGITGSMAFLPATIRVTPCRGRDRIANAARLDGTRRLVNHERGRLEQARVRTRYAHGRFEHAAKITNDALELLDPL